MSVNGSSKKTTRRKSSTQAQAQSQAQNNVETSDGVQGKKTSVSSLLKVLKSKIDITLFNEQKVAVKTIFDNKVTFLTGKAGTSKTMISCYVALKMLANNQIKKIIITRANVEASEQSLGYLKGDMHEKMQPYLVPILSNMEKIVGEKEIINKLLQMGIIEVSPVQFVRGRNFEECCVLLDEAQNFTLKELEVLTSRLCKDAKMIFTSDANQIDLKKNHKSAARAIEVLVKFDGVALVELLENHRDPLAILMMEAIIKLQEEEAEENKKK